VKQAGIHWPGWFDVWATLHPEYMHGKNPHKKYYVAERRALGYPDGYEIVCPPDGEVGEHRGTCPEARRVSYRWPGMSGSASSGIYGAKVALDDGFDRIVLAGIPMTKDAGHFLPKTKNVAGDIRGPVWLQLDCFAPGFEIAKPHLRGKVRSMSGLTKDILGYPDQEWLGCGD
jgi:hypothetical protein